MDRPFEDRRPIGPFFSTDNDDNSEDNEYDDSELEQFRDDVAESTNVHLTLEEARALKSIESPMLQSYLMNSMSDVISRGYDRNLKQIVNAKPANTYAMKLGATDELHKAQAMLSSDQSL